MKKLIILGGVALATIGLGAALAFYGNQPISSMNNLSFSGDYDTVVSQTAVHWHPQLTIYIRGKKQDIPANIGIGTQYSGNTFYDSMMSMTDIHTHDGSGTLHWEVMQGPVKKGYLKLGNFFEIWGNKFNSQQIFDFTNNDKEKVKMTVNGQPNYDFENYIIKDKDSVEIRYE